MILLSIRNCNDLIAALASSIASAFAIQLLKSRVKMYGETAIAILFSAGLALGVILLSLGHGFTIDIFSFLFGSILAVSNNDLIIIIILGLIVPSFILLLYKKCFFPSCVMEPEMASNLLSCSVCSLRYTVLIGILQSAEISIAAFGVLMVASIIARQYLSDIISKMTPFRSSSIFLPSS
ncbi:MAG: metal ABC transporter permease [Thaumarchaeota archaeon]|nr:metal ABC transporter permease [Nitrososphaerota archaeon]